MSDIQTQAAADATEAKELLGRLVNSVEDDFKVIVSKIHNLVEKLEGHVTTAATVTSQNAEAATSTAPEASVGVSVESGATPSESGATSSSEPTSSTATA